MNWARGIISRVEDAAPFRVKVWLPEDGIESAWLPVLHPATLGPRVWMPLRAGSQVALLLDEHGEDGLVLGACYGTADPPPVANPAALHLELPDGGSVSWDPETSAIAVAGMGDVTLSAAGRIAARGLQGLSFVGAGPVDLQALEDMTVKASGRLTLEAYDGVRVNAYDACEVVAAVSVLVQAASIALDASAAVTVAAPQTTFKGAVKVLGNLEATGDLMVAGRTPAHHTHPVSGSTAAEVP